MYLTPNLSFLEAELLVDFEPRAREAMRQEQLRAMEFVYEKRFCALFIDTGLGKTVIMLTVINDVISRDITQRFLIIAPIKVAAQTWPNEMGEWEHTAWLATGATVLRPDDEDPEVIAAGKEAYAIARELGGSTSSARQAMGHARTAEKKRLWEERINDDAPIHLINIESLEKLIDHYSVWVPHKKNKNKVVRKIVGWPYQNIILDESSKFKEHDTYRFNALKAVRVQCELNMLVELTATPASESYIGLFPQVFLIDLGKRLGNNITAYRNEYFRSPPHSKGRVWELMPGSKERISEKIADIAMVMKEEDYTESRWPLMLDRKLKMDADQQKLYSRMKNNFIVSIDDIEVEAKTAADLSSKLLQMAGGAIYDAERKVHVIHDHVLNDLEQLREEVTSPILVAYWYKHTLARLRKRFPNARVIDSAGKLFDGRNSPWCKGKIDMLIVHPASVGHGMNGQYGPGHDLYMADPCWSYELFYQLWRRLARPGQAKRVRVHRPQMIGTHHMTVYDRLDDKKDAQEALFDSIKRLWRKRHERRAH